MNNLGHLVRICFYTWVVFEFARDADRAFDDARRAHKSIQEQNKDELELRAPENCYHDRRMGILGGICFSALAVACGWCAYESGKALVS